MSIVGWLILGPIAGFIASKIGRGAVLDIVLGIVGAVVGGFLFSLVGAAPVAGFNIYSMIVAVVGAIVVLVSYHAIVGRRGRRQAAQKWSTWHRSFRLRHLAVS
jgi:uncharacterized membrane protein YeaQ/YmgE (transglycosylase-associated protein family)